MKKRLLDLGCCAGCGADGYTEAGFSVTGVDIALQKNYPYTFRRYDMVDVLDGKTPIKVEDFDVIHASPPCQPFSVLRRLNYGDGQDAITSSTLLKVADRLVALGKPFIIENVPGAHLPDKYKGLKKITLCGQSFNLRVKRHRVFWTNMPIKNRKCRCKKRQKGVNVVGIYGRMNDTIKGVDKRTGNVITGGKTAKNLDDARDAMGMKRIIPWKKLREGIPPRYTKYLGKRAMRYLNNKK